MMMNCVDDASERSMRNVAGIVVRHTWSYHEHRNSQHASEGRQRSVVTDTLVQSSARLAARRAGDAGKGPMWNKACLRYRKSQWHAGYAGEGSMWECGRGMPEYDRSLLLFITMACSMPAIGSMP